MAPYPKEPSVNGRVGGRGPSVRVNSRFHSGLVDATASVANVSSGVGGCARAPDRG